MPIFVMWTLQQNINIPFYVFFPFMCFKQVFYESFYNFFFQEENKSRKNPGNFSVSPIFFTGPIALVKSMIWYNVQKKSLQFGTLCINMYIYIT